MRKLLISACILFSLMSCNIAERNQHESKKAGVLHLASLKTNDIASCHACIVRGVGITRILLLKSDSTSRIYWIEGSTDIARAFVVNCINRHMCAVSAISSKTYIPEYFSITRRLEYVTVKHSKAENYLERSIFQWSKLMISGKYKSETAELEVYPDESHQQHNAYIWKQPKIIQALFFNEIGTEPIVRSMGGNSNKAQSNQDELPTDLSIRCIYSFNRIKEAVCRECLALHSKSLAIGTFHLFSAGTIRPPIELCVFSSTFQIHDILANCQIRFCPAILALDQTDCQDLKRFFPTDRLFMDSQVVSDYTNGKYQKDNRIHISKNGLEATSISHILSQVAARRQSEVHQVTQFTEKDKQILRDRLKIMTGKEPKCLMVTSSKNELRRCFSCVIGVKKGDARVIITLSLTHATIVTDTIPHVLKGYCEPRCNSVNLLSAKDCSKYLLQHAMDIESHHRLLESPYSDPLLSSCMLLYHIPSRKEKCARCIRKIFNVKEEPQPTTAFSLLLDASDTSPQTTQKFFGQSTDCHTLNTCRRIQQAPNRFCSEHGAYVGMSSGARETQKIEQSTIHQLTKAKIPLGVWPPNNKDIVRNDGIGTPSPIHSTPFLSQTGTNVWPAYEKIAFVEFASAQSEQLKCADCLVQHSEVFFVYTSGNGFSGYVWMHQAPAHIFLDCLRTFCISLTYDDRQSFIDRPIGLRQCNTHDIK